MRQTTIQALDNLASRLREEYGMDCRISIVVDYRRQDEVDTFEDYFNQANTKESYYSFL